MPRTILNTLVMILPALFIGLSPRGGRGVFAGETLKSGTVIEISPVIVLDPGDRATVDRTLLHDYIFLWGDNQDACCVALGYVSLYNHDYTANCEYEMEFDTALIRIITVRDIRSGEELCINYNGTWNDPKPVWFDAVKG